MKPAIGKRNLAAEKTVDTAEDAIARELGGVEGFDEGRRLRAHDHRPPDAGEDKARYDPGPEILEILEEQHTAWRPLDHWLLMGGILLIVLSFATDLFFVTLAN